MDWVITCHIKSLDSFGAVIYCFSVGSLILYNELFLQVWDTRGGIIWLDDSGQERGTQHNFMRYGLNPDCLSVFAQVSRPVKLLGLVQMWTGRDIMSAIHSGQE